MHFFFRYLTILFFLSQKWNSFSTCKNKVIESKCLCIPERKKTKQQLLWMMWCSCVKLWCCRQAAVWVKGYTSTHEAPQTLVKCDVLLEYDPLTLTCQLATRLQHSLQTARTQIQSWFIFFLVVARTCLPVPVLLLVHTGSVTLFYIGHTAIQRLYRKYVNKFTGLWRGLFALC